MAGGATLVLIPEEKFNIDNVAESLIRRHNAGRYASIVVVAEGALPEEGTMELREPGLDQYGHKRLGESQMSSRKKSKAEPALKHV